MKNEAKQFDKDLEEELEKRTMTQRDVDRHTIVHGDSKIGDLMQPKIKI